MFWSTRIGRRLLTGCAAALVSVVAVVACSDQNATQPTAPEALNPGPQLDVTPFTCPSQAAVDGLITKLIKTLYGPPQPSKVLQAQLTKYSSFKSKLPSKPSDALKKMADLAQSTLVDLKTGKVNGIPSPAGENVALLIGYLACYYNYFNGTAADIPVPNLTTDLTSGTTSVGVFVPGGTTNQTFRGPHNFSGTVLPPNAYPEALFITIEELTDDPPLLTDLAQYPKFSRFHAEPVDGSLAAGDPPEDHVVTFTNDVTVSLCQSGVPAGVAGSLRLAHNIYPFNFGDIEILPKYMGESTNPAGLICTSFAMDAGPSDPASWLLGRTLPARMKQVAGILSPLARFLLPDALNAAVLAGVTSGNTRNYSPFGAVDDRIELIKQTPDPQNALENSTITEAVLAVRFSDHTTPLRALPVTLVPSDPTTVPDSSIATSSASGLFGLAATDWSLKNAGTSTLTFKVLPAAKVPSGYSSTDATFTANVTAAPTEPPTGAVLTFSVQPADGCVDQAIPGVDGGIVTVFVGGATADVAVSLEAINSNGKKVALTGGTASSDASGYAIFPSLTVNQPGGYNFVATADGYASATSLRINIAPSCGS